MHLICKVMDERGSEREGVGGPGGVPSVQPVPAYHSPITGIYRDAPARDDGAHLTALETAASYI